MKKVGNQLHTKESHIETLLNLGLTPSMAKIYLAMIKTGIDRVKRISEITDIARPHVYEAIDQLEKEGLIEKSIDKPTIKAISLDDGIKLLILQKKKETLKLTQGIDKLLQDYKKNKEITDFQEPRRQFIWLREGKPYIQRRFIEISNSQKSIEFITSSEMFHATLLTFQGYVKKALNRGVKIRAIIVNQSSKAVVIPKCCKNLLGYSNYQLKQVQETPLTVLAIFDGKKMIVDTNSKLGLREVPALWTNNPSILLFASNYFENLWQKSIPINNQ